jgi:hypothetical protein
MLVPEQHFPGFLPGLLRQAQVPVSLVVEYADPTDTKPAPLRSLALRADLDRHPPTTRTVMSGIFAFVLLLFGGITSLLLNHSVPNAARRVGLRSQLAGLSAKAKALSAAIPSLLRMELRVQPLELSHRVNTELSFFPGAADVFAAAARDTAVLQQRVGLVSKIDERLARIERMGGEGPPALLHDQTTKLRQALRLLAPPTPDALVATTVEQISSDVDAQLQRIENEDEAVRTALLDEARTFWTAWEPEYQQLLLLQPRPGWLESLHEQMAGFLTLTGQCFSGSGAADQSLASLDTTLSKLKLIVNYLHVCRVATPEQTKRFDEIGRSDETMPHETQRTQRQRFFECLSGVGAHSLNQAHLVLRQAQQGIFVKHIAEQLEHRKFRVEAEPQSSVNALEPVRFRFVFLEDKFNGAAAREKLDCVWTFRHASTTYEEHGWEASQAFISPGKRTVSVSVRRGAETIATGKGYNSSAEPLFELTIDVAKRSVPMVRQRTQLELVQLGVALVVTLGALVSGAREQLDKLSLLSSIAAIFALGFGADVVKNIISRRPVSPPGSPN